ncbi:hypothetical protein [Proteiniphilum sp. X52]|uniref:hypothetical protein n=1 Tax=Proteiniphilum sp. X52 TaxID=2382159 RepID=UPI000F09F2A3|nr:hypothetical protein [Proteiniphilum sp. X52]RNC64275.1 hypothetical protein D7D25_12055 [Proteiniphilum sp. X52]
MLRTITNEIKNKLKIPGKSNKKDWKSERLHELEMHRQHSDTLPFKVVDVKIYGFLAKVKGLYAYISFNHMPWRYFDRSAWLHVAPSLIGKKFYCKIHRIVRERFSIILDGDVPQFKQAELAIGGLYKGLIIHKREYGLFIDIGYHFNWRHGSIVGLLHKTKLEGSVSLDDMEGGTTVQVIYLGESEDGHIELSQNETDVDWALGIPQKMVGQTTWVKVARNEETQKQEFLVLDKYKGMLLINKEMYPSHRKAVRRAKNALSDSDSIPCVVVGCDDRKCTLVLKWLVNMNLPEKVPVRRYPMAEMLDERSIIILEDIKEKIDASRDK